MESYSEYLDKQEKNRDIKEEIRLAKVRAYYMVCKIGNSLDKLESEINKKYFRPISNNEHNEIFNNLNLGQ